LGEGAAEEFFCIHPCLEPRYVTEQPNLSALMAYPAPIMGYMCANWVCLS
jgi:hypothetical protein